MVSISVLYILLLSGAIAESDLAWLFFIEVTFCVSVLLFVGLVREVNHCYRTRPVCTPTPRPEILQLITAEEI